MRRIIFSICLLLCLNIAAQPAWVKKAAKSIFTIKTFADDGSMIASSNGFFINKSGDAISGFSPFKGASKAIVIDAQGKEYEVEYILGANETYDVVKFKTNNKKSIPLSISTTEADDSTTVWLLPYSAKKTPLCHKGVINKAEVISTEYKYYTISANVTDNVICCPFLNENGEVIGIMQESSKSDEGICYAVSARFANDLKLSGLSINDPVLKSTNIKKSLPEDVDQAILTLYIANGSLDSVAYRNLVEDFIEKFPNSADGYIYRAQIEWDENNFGNVDKDIEKAFEITDKKDDVHFTYARLIFSKEIYKNNIEYSNWNIEKAISETDMAYSINPLPTYKQLKAQILFYKKDYQGAYDIYKQITDNGNKTPELFFEQAKCKELLNDTLTTIALLDSALNTFNKPYLKEAAPYLFARAQTLFSAGQYRKAVFDYNEYEKLIATGLNDRFYYIRFQAEVNGNLFQQALNDINKAIEINPNNTIYYAEKASLEVRVNLYDDAINTAKECIKVDPNNSDGYLFLGLALCLKGEKVEGTKNLEKAKELGDNQAQGLIEKYGK